jgi:hypothetical protein
MDFRFARFDRRGAETEQWPGEVQLPRARERRNRGSYRILSSSPSQLSRFGRLWLTPAVLLAAACFLYLQLFVLPFTPRYPSGDQSIYLNHAARMIDGDLIYRDFDHFTTPGTDVLYTALFRLFGVRTWVPQAMLIVVGVLITWLAVDMSKKVLSGAIAYLPAFIFLTFPYSSYRDATHHWYSTLAVTAALAVVLEKRSEARIACAGFLWGAGTFFTQSVAIGAGGLALFLVWESRQLKERRLDLLGKELILFASFAVTIATCCAYFISKVGLNRFLYFTAVFVAKYYPADSFNNWRVYMTGHPSFGDWMHWPDLASFVFIHLLIPLVYILFFVRYGKERQLKSAEPWHRLMLINVVGTCLFVSVAPAPAFSRLCTVSLPALILAVWFLKPAFVLERSLRYSAWLTVVIIAIARPVIEQVCPKELLELPTGRTAFTEPILWAKCEWVSERTNPSEFFFGDQNITFSLRLRNAGRVSFLRPTDYTRPEEVQDLVSALERNHVRFVSWYAGLDREGALDPLGDHLEPVRAYLRGHYRMAKAFSNGDQIWERTK